MRRLSRRSMLALTAGCLGAGLLAACAPTAAPETEDTGAEQAATTAPLAQEKVSILWMFWGSPEQQAAYEEIANNFMQVNDQIEVQPNLVPFGEYFDKLQTMIAGGVPPDLAMASPIWVPAFAQKGIYSELDSFVERDSYDLSKHFEASVKAFTIKGKLYGMPGLLNPSSVIYNKALFDEAGLEYPDGSWDWDQYLETAKALTVVEDGRTVQFGTTQQSTLNPIIPFIWMNGGEVFDDDENPTKCVMTMPETVEAVRWMAELQTEHHVAPTAEQLAEIPNAFVTGKIAMQFFGAAGLSGMVKSAAEMDWDCTYLPAGKAGLIDFLGSASQGIPGTSTKREAAWEFVKYVTGPEGVQPQIKYQWGVPSIIELAEKDFVELPPPPEHREIYIDMIEVARVLPKAPAMLEMYNPIFGKWLGEAMAGRSTPEEACQEIETGVNEILQREQGA